MSAALKRQTLAHQADAIRELQRRVRTLTKRLRAAERTAQLRAVERDQAIADNRQLRRERLQLAKLAAPTPQFFNPRVVWDAQALRDRILAGEH